jgi:SSS family solute:Na+ symporter
MSPSAVSLTTIFVIVAMGAAIGFLAGVHRKMDLEQWTVGGRGFGAVLMYLLMAGEVYTTFSFLGASGWAYSRGGPTLYIMAYMTLAYVVSFFILPQIWEVGRNYGMQTQSDFFSLRYGNKYLAGFVCVVGIASFIPYLQLQITGVGIIVSIASFDGIGRTPAMAMSVVLLVAFVFASGVRAVAWVSVLKDVLMVFAAVSIGIGIPYIHFGGIGLMFAALAHSRPAHLTMPGGSYLVHFHGSSDFAGFLHVAARVWGRLHREKRRHLASQRGSDAPLHHHASLYLHRRLYRGFGRTWLAQWRPLALDDHP